MADRRVRRTARALGARLLVGTLLIALLVVAGTAFPQLTHDSAESFGTELG